MTILPRTVGDVKKLNDSDLGLLWAICDSRVETAKLTVTRSVWERRLKVVENEMDAREEEARFKAMEEEFENSKRFDRIG